MSVSTIVQMRGKGAVTLPVELRRKYGLDEGDVFALIELGDGCFLLTPRIPQVDRLGDRVAEALAQEGVSVEQLLTVLEEEREQYYRERYAPS